MSELLGMVYFLSIRTKHKLILTFVQYSIVHECQVREMTQMSNDR